MIFYYAAKKANSLNGENAIVKYVVRCGACYLKCIEKVCDYINTAAFAYMAASGKSFCPSAWNGFLLNIKHMLKFAWGNMIAKVFVFLGKIAIVVGNCFSFKLLILTITKETI